MKNILSSARSQKGGIELLILAIVIIASFILVGGPITFHGSSSQNPNQAVTIVQSSSQPSNPNQSLQIQGLKATTPSPTPTPNTVCNHDNGQPAQVNDGKPVTDPNCICPQYLVECKNKQCVSVTTGVNKTPTNCSVTDSWCSNQALTAGIDGVFCLGKPVIYLYPTKDTPVNVKVNTPGSIVESIPAYTNTGWNVLAHPNGNIEDNGKTYKELYYESSVTKVNAPKEGFIVEKNNAEVKLREITSKLGLIKPEQEEFLAYWLPKINNLNSPYIFISVIDKNEKERIDNVEIIPQPNTKIEFLVYFKPVYKPFSVPELNFPAKAPERIGFTSVEWGGTIDTNQ